MGQIAAASECADGPEVDLARIRCVVFDFGNTLSSDWYFKYRPPECPDLQELVQRHIFSDQDVVNRWMAGELVLTDIAARISSFTCMDVPSLVRAMEKGCETLVFNPAVMAFAAAQRGTGRKTALVTANMDVFTRVVVPAHHLDQIFDVILNTSDYRVLSKDVLWPLAFERLGPGIHYANSLLIEDGTKEPALFRKHGGEAYQYSTDYAFQGWLNSIGWRSQ
jgi:phosphoserine phosphatase